MNAADVFQWSQADWYLAVCGLGMARILLRMRDSVPWIRAVALGAAFAVAYYTTAVRPASPADHGAALIAVQYRNPLHWAAMAVAAASVWRFRWPRRHWGSPARIFGWRNT